MRLLLSKNLVAPLLVLLFTALPSFAQSYSVQGANAYVQSKDWNGLLSYAQGWTQAEPENATAWFYLGNTYGVGLNDPASAAPAFKHAVSINPSWPEAWNALGQVYAATGRYQQAADALSRAVQLAPRRPSYWNNLAAVYTDQNDFERAAQTVDRGVEQSGGQANAFNWYIFGNAYSNMRHYRKAIDAYNRAIAMNPSFAEAYNNRGVAEQLSDNSDAALGDFHRASQLGNDLGEKNYSELYRAMHQPKPAGGACPPAHIAKYLPGGSVECFPNSWMTAHPHCAIGGC